MILTCPECATSYFVDDDRIPPAGRSVKCSSCGNRWKALPDGAAPEAPRPAPPPAPAPVTEAPPPVEDIEIVPSPAREARRKAIAEKKTKGPPVLLIGVAGLAVVAAAAGAAAIFREQVAGMIPGTAPVFAALGLPVNTLGLNFETVAWKPTFVAGRPVMAVTGAIRNTTDHAVESPPVRVSLLNKDKKPLAEYRLTVTNARVPPGGVRHFAWNLPDPPAGMSKLDIAFEQEGGHGEAVPHGGKTEHTAAAAGPPPEPVEAKPLPPDSPDALPHHE